MNQRYALLAEGSRPVIYKIAANQTARLKNEIPGRKVEVFETLNHAKEAALTLVEHAKANARSGITMFSAQPNSEDEALLKRLSELTEDRVERYPF